MQISIQMPTFFYFSKTFLYWICRKNGEIPLNNDYFVLQNGHSFCNSRYKAAMVKSLDTTTGDPDGSANCNTNANFFLNFRLKMQRLWRIAPKTRWFCIENAEIMENCPYNTMILHWKCRKTGELPLSNDAFVVEEWAILLQLEVAGCYGRTRLRRW